MANVAMLSTMADQEASQLAGAVSDLMPAGVILPYGGATAPAGWLLCNGAQISRTTYAKLFAAIGTAHGSGNGSSTFHLPDLRGRFLRGRDGGAARDPNRTTRTAANSGGATGDSVGSVQGNATAKNGLSATAAASSISALTLNASSLSSGTCAINKNQFNSNQSSHAHNLGYGANIGGGGVAIPNFSGSTSSQATSSNNASWFSANANGSAAGTANAQSLNSGTAAAQAITVANGDSETRPTNANVNYIIKV